MSRVSYYFCIFCDFKCNDYKTAFNHYDTHIFMSRNCEICDYSYKLGEYVADSGDHRKCVTHDAIIGLSQITGVIHYWINKFLSYQKKILDTTYEQLLVGNKVCVECAVCRYLVDNYKSNGGDMNLIQYIRDNKVEHCYQHMRYNPDSAKIIAYLAKSDNPLRYKTILKLESFIVHCCDTFFTGENHNDANNSLANRKITDQNCVIDNNECLSCSDATETCSQLSSGFEDILQQSLAPLLAKISLVEREIKDIKLELLAIKEEKILSHSKATQFYIANIDTALVIDIGGYNRGPYAPIIMYSYRCGRNQLWEYKNGMIHSALNNLVLDINQTDGMRVITNDVNGSVSQKWHFDSDNTVRCEYRNLVLDVDSEDGSQCAKVIARPKHNHANQLFRIVYV